MFFRFILIHIFVWISIASMNFSEFVEQLHKWPVPVESIVNFSIAKNYNDKSELLIKILNDREEELTHKYVRVTKKRYVDLSTDYFIIKKEKIFNNREKFIFKMSFYKISYGKYLSIEWLETGNKSDATILLYKEKILLTKEWRIDVKVQVLELEQNKQVYLDDVRLFQPGKKVKVSCSAYDGLPPAKLDVSNNLTHQFREISYDESLNQWVGYLTLAVGDHNKNLSCHVQGSSEYQIYTLIVNHPTTDVKLIPDRNGYITNGSVVTCQPVDGYPTSSIKLDFVSAKNNSNPESLYKIINDSIYISPTVPMGTEIEFNCSALYTNPIDGIVTVVTKTFGLKVGEQPKTSTNFNIAAIGASVTGVIIVIIAVLIVILLCRSKPKSSRSASHLQQESPKYDGSLLAGSKTAIRNQAKSHNGSNTPLMMADSSASANTDQNELNYDDMPRGRRPIKVVDDPVIYSTIVGTMQPKSRPSLDLGPIDRV